MSYEFTHVSDFNALIDTLESLGRDWALDSETYAWDTDDAGYLYGTGGNELSFDSMSTFDENDMDYQRSLMY